MIFLTTYDSPLGTLTLATRGSRLAGLWMEGQAHFGSGLLTDGPEGPPVQRKPEKKIFQETMRWLDRYFAGKAPLPYELRLAPEGSNFQTAVWDILCTLPYGESTTYGELAEKLGLPKTAAQAVGGAVGRNPISIIIPCHRVLGAEGKLIGYAGGLDRKRFLLDLEGISYHIPRSTPPKDS
ncbi:MAG: methylated-DNA--[Clostridia bacterium]|nr:methylated-DNA--[protein]-cysteine S-methyltransferase [Clostridia bacterium]